MTYGQTAADRMPILGSRGPARASATLQMPDKRLFPFDWRKPFAAATLGLMQSTTATVDDDALAAHLVLKRDGTAAEAAYQNPTALNTGAIWCMPIDCRDLVRLSFYLAKISAGAYASFGEGENVAKCKVWLGRQLTADVHDDNDARRYLEIITRSALDLSLTASTDAQGVNANSRKLPTGAKFVDTITIDIDNTRGPGAALVLDGADGAGGVPIVEFDSDGALFLFVRPYNMAAGVGLGVLTSHL